MEEDKLNEIVLKYEKIKAQLCSADSQLDFSQYSELNRTFKEIEDVVGLYRSYKKHVSRLQENKRLLLEVNEEALRDFIKEDITKTEEEIISLEEAIERELIPKDPDDHKNVVLELHAGVGGDEAGIFVGDLFRMYCRYAESKSWKVSVVDYIEAVSGGYKDLVCTITGRDVYSYLKYESGVHRVQRVPKTENKGRVHTSAASVVVMPESDDITVDLDMKDIRKDTFCSSGAGGQSVNTTYSAVRLTHIPTGIVVTCQDERSQIKNYERALKVLQTRISKMVHEKHDNEIREQKKEFVKSGDRADKIRTYNYPQNRITDHRVEGLTVYNLDHVMEGYLDEIIKVLKSKLIVTR